MEFNHLTTFIKIGYDGLISAKLDGVFPVIIDEKEQAVYSVNKGNVKGNRILGVEYWNQYSKQHLIAHVISASQLGNNYKWFLDEIVENIELLTQV